MKKYIKNLQYIGIALLLASTSCVPLDVTPYDKDTDVNYWNKPTAAIDMVNTCYTGLSNAYEQMYSDAMTDNAYTKVTTPYNQSIGNGTYSTADSYVLSVWNTRYTGIRNCNLLLNNIDKVPDLTDELRNRYVWEVTFIRAYHYFELYSKFGDVPYFTNVISIGESQKIGRTSKAEIVNNILQELTTVIDNEYLPVAYDSNDKGRITRWAAMALKARILLFEGRYEEVKNITQAIMNDSNLALFINYEQLFTLKNENNIEVMLDVQYLENVREQKVQYEFLPPSIGGYAQLAPLQELVDDYITADGYTIKAAPLASYDPNHPFDNRDPRLAATIVYTDNWYTMADGSKHVVNADKGGGIDGFGNSSDCSPTGYYIKKYWDNTYRADFQSGLNFILIRYADVLLMNAEALVELGQFNAAAWDKTIKPLRQRAGFTSASALDFPNGADLKDIVRRERRCEFAMEGLRHKDIIRWKIADKVLNGWCHGFKTNDLVGTDNGFVRVENRKFDVAKNYLWPIPQNERDLNGNLTQNTNW